MPTTPLFDGWAATLPKSADAYNNEIIDIDKRGDLVIVCKEPNRGGPCRLRVCSRTLARVSSVFERMLYGREMFHGQRAVWIESKPEDGDCIVHLPEDPVEEISILLIFCHMIPSSTACNIHIEEIYGLMIQANKYAMQEVIKGLLFLFSRIIEEDFVSSSGSCSECRANAKTLAVVWCLGQVEDYGYQSLASDIASRSFVRHLDGRVTGCERKLGTLLEDGSFFALENASILMPEGVLVSIEHARHDCIQHLLNAFHSPKIYYTETQPDPQSVRKFQDCLRCINGQPLPKRAQDMNMSLHDLSGLLWSHAKNVCKNLASLDTNLHTDLQLYFLHKRLRGYLDARLSFVDHEELAMDDILTTGDCFHGRIDGLCDWDKERTEEAVARFLKGLEEVGWEGPSEGEAIWSSGKLCGATSSEKDFDIADTTARMALCLPMPSGTDTPLTDHALAKRREWERAKEGDGVW